MVKPLRQFRILADETEDFDKFNNIINDSYFRSQLTVLVNELEVDEAATVVSTRDRIRTAILTNVVAISDAWNAIVDLQRVELWHDHCSRYPLSVGKLVSPLAF